MEILQNILPALLVLLTAYLLIDKLLKSDEKRRNYDLQKENTKITTPLRLRAYERLMLVLERTAPAILVMNAVNPSITNQELHQLLLSSIREEFSHNVSQQIYVSNELWSYMRSAQESLVRLINTCASKCDPKAPSSDLGELIIRIYSESEQTPSELAQEKLKNEVRAFL